MKINKYIILLSSCVLLLSSIVHADSHNGKNKKEHDDQGNHNGKIHTQVIVPGEDRFSPFAIKIKPGDTVEWVNNDTDDHTVVSLDNSSTTGPKLIDHLLLGTDNNAGNAGTFQIKFKKPGTFVYYCRFHSALDAFNQPVAPGPDGGIQTNGNFGTPMMGVVEVRAGE